MSSVEPGFREQIQALKWYSCLAVPEKDRQNQEEEGHESAANITQSKKDDSAMVCRCCCFPFRPNPKTLLCEHIPGAPMAPGEEEFDFGTLVE